MMIRLIPLTVALPIFLAACGTAPSETASSGKSIKFDSNNSSGVGVTRFARAEGTQRVSTASDRDCSDFAGGRAAQQFFVKAGGPSNDPHDLDRDGDGYACEWGNELRRREAAEAATSRCHTGPRGGTYTITASGRKNYDGC